jgi:hypothetical protein
VVSRSSQLESACGLSRVEVCSSLVNALGRRDTSDLITEVRTLS